MKKLLLTGLLFAGLGMYAQTATTPSTNPKTTWSCQSATFNKEDNTILLSGAVNFKTETIDIKNADKIVYNTCTKEIVATGVQNFEIKGSVQVAEQNKRDTLTYRLGDDIAYMN